MKPIRLALLFLSVGWLACARSVPTAPADSTHSLTHDGIERTYILHVPPAYDKNKPTPLVLLFHGGAGNAENQRRASDFNTLADEKDSLSFTQTALAGSKTKSSPGTAEHAVAMRLQTT